MLSILLYIILFLFALVGLFLLFFLRNPKRVPPAGEVILAPADGLVVVAGEEGNWARVAIFMSPLNVHVQWVPYPGKVVKIEKVEGTFRSANLDEASHNKQVITTIETKLGTILVKQMVGLLVRRIETFVKVGDELKVGQRLGRIMFGSRVELWLPKDKVTIVAKKNQKVLAGLTIVAQPK
jgi:phosphatidylserine decarboxylase